MNLYQATSSLKNKPIPKTQVQHFLQNPFYSGTMRYDGKLLPHKYEPLIEPWLWRKIQEVDIRRTRVRSKYAGKEYIHKDLIRCAHCEYSVSTDGPKKGNNYYMKCTEYGGKHGAKWVNENKINAQVVAILQNIKVPEHILPKIVEDLRNDFENEQQYYKRNLVRIQKQYDQLDEEIKDMFRDRSSFKIRPELFDELVSEKVNLQGDLLEQIKDHSKGNERFILSASKILEVASNASQLFMSDSVRISQKRRLLDFVLSNTKLDGETLQFELKSPLM